MDKTKRQKEENTFSDQKIVYKTLFMITNIVPFRLQGLTFYGKSKTEKR